MRRRQFLKRLSLVLESLIALVLTPPVVRFLFDPLWRSRGNAVFRRVAPLSIVQGDTPIRVVIHADRRDAFTRYPPGPIGRVWLMRGQAKQGASRVRCLQSICPHLGCDIDYGTTHRFSCPCHASDFDTRGKRLSGPSPRDMDELPCRVTGPDEKGMRWIEVKYVEFQTSLSEKRPIL